MERERVGFIGLGVMGKPMAFNLLRSGYPLMVFNRSRRPLDELAEAGATPAASPRVMAEQCDVIVTMLPDSPDVEAVVLGPGGVLEGARPGALLIDMSTVAAATARKLAESMRSRGADALDAPVSGGDIGAREGTLSIMVGGRTESFERALPILKAMGRSIIHIGPAGAGQVAKSANQMVVAMTIQAVGEALTLAAKAGVDPARVREALLGGFAQSRVLDVHGKRLLERQFAPGFKARLQRKDLGIALATGRELGVPLPGTALVHELISALVSQGKGELDHSALMTVVEGLAGGPADG